MTESRSQQYDRIITELSTRQSTSIPLFTEATTQATELTESPISILSLVNDRGCQIEAISGLKFFDKLPADPNLSFELAGIEYCHHQAMICERYFTVGDFQEHSELNTTAIFQSHGIRSYVGVPIITAAGDILGIISILDFVPERFRQRDIALLQLVSRWLASEFERKFLSQAQLSYQISDLRNSIVPVIPERNHCEFDNNVAVVEHVQNAEQDSPKPKFRERIKPYLISEESSFNQNTLSLTYLQIKTEIQFKLSTHLAQKLRTPLTSILGMTSVLQQEIYGSLSSKQKDYLGIVHSSGQKLVAIIDEIAHLAIFDAEVSALTTQKQQHLNLKSVDLEMLCQLAIQNLEPLLHQKQQQISIDLSKGNRIWLLDKDKVQQIIYYLSLSSIEGSGIGHQISIELANSTDRLQLQITTTDPHPTLRDDLFEQHSATKETLRAGFRLNEKRSVLMSSKSIDDETGQDLRVRLGLSLSHTLAAIHGGNIELLLHPCGYKLTLATEE